jgi:hypothetical protein
MTELLVLPGWDLPPTPLARWVEQLRSQGLSAETIRESADVSWVEVRELRLRGYAVTQGLDAEAINFEVTDPDPTRARRAVEEAAAALGWEVHDDQGGDDEDDG